MYLKYIRKSFKYILLLIILLAEPDYLAAQGRFSLTGGWGYYELANVGAQWNITNISSLSLYGGTNFNLRDYKSWSAGLSFDQTFKKPVFWKLKPGYSVGLLYWTRDDELYYFENISLPVMALLAYPVSSSLAVKVEGGVLYTGVLVSDRKQNVEAGFPQRINGNIRLSIIYKIGAR